VDTHESGRFRCRGVVHRECPLFLAHGEGEIGSFSSLESCGHAIFFGEGGDFQEKFDVHGIWSKECTETVHLPEGKMSLVKRDHEINIIISNRCEDLVGQVEVREVDAKQF